MPARLLLTLGLILGCLLTPAAAWAGSKRIAFSFDDIPREAGTYFTPDERAERLIAALRQAKVSQAVFFINPARLTEPQGLGGEARIAAYAKAGHLLANHTNSHPALSATSVDEYLADIDAAEAWLRGRPGRRPWFRFPYLDEGGTDTAKRDAIRAGLAARGLRNGYVTADGSDWFLNDLVNKARADGQDLDLEQLRRLFVRMHVSSAESSDDLARLALGRSPAQVMLMHETDITAMFLPDLAAELRRHGWTIITADEAYRDQLKDAFPDVPNARGDLISKIAVEKGVVWPIWPIWIHPGIAEPIFNQRVLRKAATP